MFKKVLSILLASVLMLSSISFSVFAAGDTDAENAVASFNGEYYSTVEKALTDATNSSEESVTIEVLKDVTTLPRPTRGGLTFKAADGVKVTSRVLPPWQTAVPGTVTYDGFDFTTYDSDNGLYACHEGQHLLEGHSVIFKNCAFGGQRSIGIYNWAVKSDMESITIDNCTVADTTGKAYFEFERVKNVTIKNCDFSNYSGENYVVRLAAYSKNLNVSNSKFGTAYVNYAPNLGEDAGTVEIASSSFAGEKVVSLHSDFTNANGDFEELTFTNNTVTDTTEIVNFKDETVQVTEYFKDKNVAITAIGNTTTSGETVSDIADGYTPVASIGDKCYASIDAALADAEENDTIKIASGTYDAFDVLVDGVTITGMDADTEITVNSIPNCAFIGINANGVTVENLKFVVPESCVKTGWYNAVIGYWSKNFDSGSAGITGVDVKNCDFVNAGSDVDIAIFNFDSFEVSGNTFENFGTGITAMNDGSAMGTVKITDNTFTKVNEPVNAYWGQAGDDTDSLTLTGNSFVSAKDADEIKITIDDYAAENAGQAGISTIDMSGNTYGAETEVLLVDAAATVTTDVEEDLADAENAALTSRYDSEARIGNKYYTSLHTAITEAQEGDTVEVLNDVTVDTWNSIYPKANITINGNGHTVTITEKIVSGINGGGLFLKAENLTINDLTVNLPTSPTAEMERLATMYSGTLNNVTVTGGSFAVSVLGGEGEVVINNCNFSNINGWSVETEGKGNTALTIQDSTFDKKAVIIRGTNNTFTNNTIEKAGEGVNVLGDAVIVGNDFGESTLGIDQGRTVTLEKNIINSVEFPNWYGVEDEDYSALTVENNKLSDEALETLQATIGDDVESVDPSFEVDGEKFFTLSDAIAAAENGSVITLYESAEITAEDYAAIIEKGISVTLGDYTLTSAEKLADTSFITVPSGRKIKATSTDDGYVYSIVKKTSKTPSGISSSYYPSYDYDNDKYIPQTEETKDMSDFPFTDVKSSFWGYDGIAYCWQNNIMNGMTSTSFEPETQLSRAMLVTMLYRLAGSPEVETTENEWYSAARTWAMRNTISDGTNMNDAITREQLATMLCRYAAKQGVDTGITADLTVFTDAESISDWAYPSVNWAVRSGLMNGMGDGTLSPNSGATRAQVAAIFMRAASIIGE